MYHNAHRMYRNKLSRDDPVDDRMVTIYTFCHGYSSCHDLPSGREPCRASFLRTPCPFHYLWQKDAPASGRGNTHKHNNYFWAEQAHILCDRHHHIHPDYRHSNHSDHRSNRLHLLGRPDFLSLEVQKSENQKVASASDWT